MNTMVDDERDDQSIMRNEVANDHALRRADDGVRNSADDLGVTADAARVRDALAVHPWPVAGEALMARLHAVPEDAERGLEPNAGRSRHELDMLHDDRPIRVHWRRWVEATATVAVVVAIVALLVRRAGDDIAPADAPNAVDATAASPVSTRPFPDTPHYPAYPGYGPDDSLVDDVTSSITHPSLGMALAGRQFALLDPPNDHFAIVTDSEFRVLDGSGDLPMHLDESAEESRIVARLPGVRGTIAVSGNYAFVAGTSFYSEDQLHVVDVSDPMSPTLVASVPMSLGAWFDGSIVAQGDYVYVMRNDPQLVVFDVKDPGAPREVASQGVAGRSQIHLVGDAVLVPRDVIDVSDPTNPLNRPESAALWPYVEPIHWTVVGTRAYVPDGKSVLVLDVSDPFEMSPIGRIELAENVSGTYRDGELVVVRYAPPCCEKGAENIQRSILRPETPEPVAAAPLPPDGTRLYASIAELLADPPPAGETVWVDAYHGELIQFDPNLVGGTARNRCPSAFESVLLDEPFLHQRSAFDSLQQGIPDAGNGRSLVAAGRDADDHIALRPDLPRRGRLVLHLGDPALAHCDSAARIALVERVAHVFETKPDWLAIHQAIRLSESVGWIEGSTTLFGSDGMATSDAGAYTLAIPEGLEAIDPAVAMEMYALQDPTQSPAPDPSAALVQPDLPEHPIVLRRYLPDHPLYGERLRPREDSNTSIQTYLQRSSGPTDELARRGPQLAFTVSTLSADNWLGTDVVRVSTEVSGVLYELEITLPIDDVDAQPLLWRFQYVVDRFGVLDAGASARAAATHEPTGLELQVTNLVEFTASAIDAVDGLAIVGGQEGLAVMSLNPYNEISGLRPYAPPSPVALGLVREADVDMVARQVTGDDRDAARAMLEGDGGSWTVQAVAIRPPHGYAVVEWPEGSGLAWLHVFEAAHEPVRLNPARTLTSTLVGAARLEPAEGAPPRYITAYDMAFAGDHLLVATSAGLFDVDVSAQASPVVRAPSDGPLRTVITAVAAAPDGRRAWACGGQIDAGSVTALDLSDPGGIRVLGTRSEPHALLDCATDGSTLFAMTGSETHAIARYDVSGGGAPRSAGEIAPANGIGIGLHLFGRRLVVSATDLMGMPEGAHPAPIDPLGPGRTGLLVYDVADPAAPVQLGAIALPGPVEDLATAGRFLLAAAGENGVYVYGSADEGP